jgi:hypothetical protein
MSTNDTTLKTITYSSNNSGGDWWLSDDDWKKLEAEGWKVNWKPKRFLGALATTATKEFASRDEAITEWERITGQDAWDGGCSCCGNPHDFEEA